MYFATIKMLYKFNFMTILRISCVHNKCEPMGIWGKSVFVTLELITFTGGSRFKKIVIEMR